MWNQLLQVQALSDTLSHPKCRGFIQRKGYNMITVTQINELRKETQVSMLLCKQALEATGGDFDAAKKWLRSQGGEVAGGPSEFGFTLFDGYGEAVL